MPPKPRTVSPAVARELGASLRARIAGEVDFSAGARALYATDASNYRQTPVGIVPPQFSLAAGGRASPDSAVQRGRDPGHVATPAWDSRYRSRPEDRTGARWSARRILDAAARLRQLRQITEVNGSDLCVGRELREPVAVSSERTHPGAGRHEAARDDSAELTGGADDEHP
jgi:hypothetical protein